MMYIMCKENIKAIECHVTIRNDSVVSYKICKVSLDGRLEFVIHLELKACVSYLVHTICKKGYYEVTT